MEKIVLDTNFLLAVFELRLDIFEEIFRVCSFPYRLFVLDKTLEELEKLINSPLLSQRRVAQAALQLVRAKKVQVIKTDDPRSVDDILLGFDGYIIATADIALKRRLRKKGTRILYIRQKKYLILE